MNHSPAAVAAIKALPVTAITGLIDYPSMGWDSALTVEATLRAIGGVTRPRRHQCPEDGRLSCYSIIWHYRGATVTFTSREQFDRWISAASKTPLPAYLQWAERA